MTFISHGKRLTTVGSRLVAKAITIHRTRLEGRQGLK